MSLHCSILLLISGVDFVCGVESKSTNFSLSNGCSSFEAIMTLDSQIQRNFRCLAPVRSMMVQYLFPGPLDMQLSKPFSISFKLRVVAKLLLQIVRDPKRRKDNHSNIVQRMRTVLHTLVFHRYLDGAGGHPQNKAHSPGLRRPPPPPLSPVRQSVFGIWLLISAPKSTFSQPANYMPLPRGFR